MHLNDVYGLNLQAKSVLPYLIYAPLCCVWVKCSALVRATLLIVLWVKCSALVRATLLIILWVKCIK